MQGDQLQSDLVDEHTFLVLDMIAASSDAVLNIARGHYNCRRTLNK